jgi:hypothetical protein
MPSIAVSESVAAKIQRTSQRRLRSEQSGAGGKVAEGAWAGGGASTLWASRLAPSRPSMAASTAGRYRDVAPSTPALSSAVSFRDLCRSQIAFASPLACDPQSRRVVRLALSAAPVTRSRAATGARSVPPSTARRLPILPPITPLAPRSAAGHDADYSGSDSEADGDGGSGLTSSLAAAARRLGGTVRVCDALACVHDTTASAVLVAAAQQEVARGLRAARVSERLMRAATERRRAVARLAAVHKHTTHRLLLADAAAAESAGLTGLRDAILGATTRAEERIQRAAAALQAVSADVAATLQAQAREKARQEREATERRERQAAEDRAQRERAEREEKEQQDKTAEAERVEREQRATEQRQKAAAAAATAAASDFRYVARNLVALLGRTQDEYIRVLRIEAENPRFSQSLDAFDLLSEVDLGNDLCAGNPQTTPSVGKLLTEAKAAVGGMAITRRSVQPTVQRLLQILAQASGPAAPPFPRECIPDPVTQGDSLAYNVVEAFLFDAIISSLFIKAQQALVGGLAHIHGKIPETNDARSDNDTALLWRSEAAAADEYPQFDAASGPALVAIQVAAHKPGLLDRFFAVCYQTLPALVPMPAFKPTAVGGSKTRAMYSTADGMPPTARATNGSLIAPFRVSAIYACTLLQAGPAYLPLAWRLVAGVANEPCYRGLLGAAVLQAVLPLLSRSLCEEYGPQAVKLFSAVSTQFVPEVQGLLAPLQYASSPVEGDRLLNFEEDINRERIVADVGSLLRPAAVHRLRNDPSGRSHHAVKAAQRIPLGVSLSEDYAKEDLGEAEAEGRRDFGIAGGNRR